MFTTALLTTLVLAQEFSFGLLQDKRSEFEFIPYTPEQRVQVAQTMDNLFSIFVNRESKISYYGKERPDIDPIPKVKKIVQDAAKMTDRELHYSLADVVATQRDGHTNYYLPGSHSCQLAVKVPRFTAVEDGGFFGLGKKEKIVLNRFIRFPEAVALTPDASKMNIGDELLSVDGVPVQQFIKSKLFEWGGANESGGLRGVLYRLSIANGLFNPVPVENQNVYRMKSFNTGREYTVTVPWVVRTDVNCVAASKELEGQIKAGAVPESFGERVVPKYKKGQEDASNPFAKVDQEVYGRVDEFSKVTVNPTADPIIRWAIYEPEKRNLGIIYMSSFVPAGSDSNRVALLIRDLLLNQLKDTNALVFDIRDNGGGIVTMSDLIPQLVGKSHVPGNVRALVAPINRDIFLNSTFYPSTDQFADAYRQVKPGDKYTPKVKFTPIEVANQIGQAYLKPVGVFNNGNCYSACDLFSANMQDNGIATVYGEDRFSGAGGANVVEINTFLNPARPDHFPLFPFTEQLPESAAQNARVGWRELIRVGKNNDVRIEDLGIASDKIFRPVQADLQPNTNSNTQYDRIADDLNRQALLSGKRFMYFATTPALVSNGQLGTAASFDFDIQGLRRIEIIDENGSKKGELTVGPLDLLKRQQRQVRFDPQITQPALVKYNIRAFDGLGRQQMNTYRSVRYLPNTSDYLKVRQGVSVSIPFGDAKYAAQFDSKSIREGKLGWNLVNGALQVGDGKQYKDDVNTSISYFINSAAPSFKVTVKATYQTELDYDFVQIGFIRAGRVTQFLTSTNQGTGAPQDGISGKGVIDQTFDVQATGDVEIFVRFISDGGVTDVGATIQSITISA